MSATTIGPRPLLVVHQLKDGAAFTTACGRIAGDRRFDTERGTFVQDTAHNTLDVRSGFAGGVACADCLAPDWATEVDFADINTPDETVFHLAVFFAGLTLPDFAPPGGPTVDIQIVAMQSSRDDVAPAGHPFLILETVGRNTSQLALPSPSAARQLAKALTSAANALDAVG